MKRKESIKIIKFEALLNPEQIAYLLTTMHQFATETIISMTHVFFHLNCLDLFNTIAIIELADMYGIFNHTP